MKLTKSNTGVLLQLTDEEAGELRAALVDLDPSRWPGNLIPDLIDGIKASQVSNVAIGKAISDVALALQDSSDRWQLDQIAMDVVYGRLDSAQYRAARLDTYLRDKLPEISYLHLGLRKL